MVSELIQDRDYCGLKQAHLCYGPLNEIILGSGSPNGDYTWWFVSSVCLARVRQSCT